MNGQNGTGEELTEKVKERKPWRGMAADVLWGKEQELTRTEKQQEGKEMLKHHTLRCILHSAMTNFLSLSLSPPPPPPTASLPTTNLNFIINIDIQDPGLIFYLTPA